MDACGGSLCHFEHFEDANCSGFVCRGDASHRDYAFLGHERRDTVARGLERLDSPMVALFMGIVASGTLHFDFDAYYEMSSDDAKLPKSFATIAFFPRSLGHEVEFACASTPSANCLCSASTTRI